MMLVLPIKVFGKMMSVCELRMKVRAFEGFTAIVFPKVDHLHRRA